MRFPIYLPLLVACTIACSGPGPSAEPSPTPSSRDRERTSGFSSASQKAEAPSFISSPAREEGKNAPESGFVPTVDKGLPRTPGEMSHRLAQIRKALGRSIERWRREGSTGEGRPPETVVLQALYQQRLYRKLARSPELAKQTLRRLEGVHRLAADRIVTASRELRQSTTPVRPPITMRTGDPDPAGDLLRYYREAEERFDVDWWILAAVNSIETRFGRLKSASSAGAQGPMQFLPLTWDAYGMGGDIRDPRDAILGAANYLSESGAPGDYRGALLAYNNSNAYVGAVLRYGRELKRDENFYFVLYNWQVFVRTTRGDVRITGPKV